MPYSKTCKLVGLASIGVSTILVLVFVYSFSQTRLCDNPRELMSRSMNRCYPKESKGPCSHNLVFLNESPKSQYGACACPFTQFNRTMLYHKETERCYFVFTQAYCDEGQWLTIINQPRKGSPACEENKCLQHSLNGVQEDSEDTKHSFNYESVQWVPIKGGRCAKLGFYDEGCPEGSVVTFHPGYILPSCFKPPKKRMVHGASIGVPPSSCALGSYPSIMGKCQPEFEFDFE